MYKLAPFWAVGLPTRCIEEAVPHGKHPVRFSQQRQQSHL